MAKIRIEFEFASDMVIEIDEYELEELQQGGQADLDQLICNYGLEFEAKQEADLVESYFKEIE